MGRRLKILISIMAILTIVSAMMGAGFQQMSSREKPKRTCRGYTVIEVNKGIDCNGDTVELVKRNGFFELASN